MKERATVVILFLSIFAFGLKAQLVDRRTFFKNVIGVPEVDFQADDALKRASIEFDDTQDSFFLKNSANNKRFRAGKFSQLSIGELRGKTAAISSTTPGSFNVIEALDPAGKKYYKFVEIGANQAASANEDAVFQVASNFNALELVSSDDHMKNITGYFNDLTQGPFASISAAPGTILRHYYMFYKPDTNPSDWQQYPVPDRLWRKSDANKQINFLENTDIPIVNSYVAFSKRRPAQVNNFKVEDIQIGWHEGIQVTSGLMPNPQKHTQFYLPNQIINQVFTAAVDFSSNARYKEDPKAIQIAQAVQDAAYEGTIRAAVAAGKKKVFLTLIGGGVFANKLEWIANALEKMKDFIKKSGLEVTLVIFNGNDSRLRDQIVAFRDRMQQLAGDTGGQYKQYSAANPTGKLLVEKKEPTPAITGETTEALSRSLQTLSTELQALSGALETI